jgi:hypothetical protein
MTQHPSRPAAGQLVTMVESIAKPFVFKQIAFSAGTSPEGILV